MNMSIHVNTQSDNWTFPEDRAQVPDCSSHSFNGRTMLQQKRKRIVLTIKEKLQVIQQMEEGCPVSSLMSKYGISKSTCADIYKNKDKILSYISNMNFPSGVADRKSMKPAAYEELDKVMLKWYNDQTSRGVSVTSANFTKQAQNFFVSLGMEGEFNASHGWLKRFKIRHGIGDGAVEDKEIINFIHELQSEKERPSREQKKIKKDNKIKRKIEATSTVSISSSRINEIDIVEPIMIKSENTDVDNITFVDVGANNDEESEEQDEDEDGNFFSSLLPHVKKLPLKKKLYFRMKVQDLLYKTMYDENLE